MLILPLSSPSSPVADTLLGNSYIHYNPFLFLSSYSRELNQLLCDILDGLDDDRDDFTPKEPTVDGFLLGPNTEDRPTDSGSEPPLDLSVLSGNNTGDESNNSIDD